MTLEPFTETELDELTGSLLFIGSVSQAAAGFLEVTSMGEALEAWEFLNHLPPEVAGELLAVHAQALAAVSYRVDQHGEAIASALHSLEARVQAEAGPEAQPEAEPAE